MGEVSATAIGTFREAPSGSSRIELYNYNGSEDMTVAQLIMAISIRCSAIYERQSVVQMNMMSRGVDNIELLSGYGDSILAGDNDKWKSTIRNALKNTFKVKDSALPAEINTYSDRMAAMEQIQQLLTQENSDVDRIAIEAETAINRRDSVYDMATQCVTHFGGSLMTAATNMVMR